VAKVAIDYDAKTAEVTMKPNLALKREVVEAAMKKSGRYGVTAFKEKAPPKKTVSGAAIIGISGMT
jgi:copper chaperone CopZ